MRFDSNSKTIDNRGNAAVFLFDSNGIKRRNRNKKILKLKKIRECFYQKNGLLKDRQNGSWTLIQVRPKTAPAIAITSDQENNTESIHGWLLHSRLCSGVQSSFISTLEADVNRVLVAASLSIKSIDLLSCFRCFLEKEDDDQ
jgi:hypothetical protein